MLVGGDSGSTLGIALHASHYNLACTYARAHPASVMVVALWTALSKLPAWSHCIHTLAVSSASRCTGLDSFAHGPGKEPLLGCWRWKNGPSLEDTAGKAWILAMSDHAQVIATHV